MSMVPVSISVVSIRGDTNLHYMTASTILHRLLSQTANRQLNGISSKPDCYWVVAL